jgi:murein DD-endopeptidase MepM/ murein hydrolase activator NlpD
MCGVTVAGQFTATLLDTSEVRTQRDGRWGAFHEAVGAAARTAGEGRTVQELRAQGEQQLVEASAAISIVGRQKYETRMRLADAVERLRRFREQYGVDPEDPEALARFTATQLDAMQSALRWYGSSRLVSASSDGTVLTRLLTASLPERAQEYVYTRAVQDARMYVVTLSQDMTALPQLLATLRADHDTMLTSYHAALDAYDDAERTIALSDARLAQIKQIAADVEEKIRTMQVELAQYDERIRQRAEGDLIALGLLSGRRESGRSVPEFIWPTVGRITAHFLDADYAEFFGIPHKAVDIAQAQGSIVRAAADGVVHYVQHGGARGYSYILIGHRGGFATLYGHMLEIHVQSGEDVHQGQTIGLSGGEPGTIGAGPMTTGAHLHFEVIQDGVHLDPITVLP